MARARCASNLPGRIPCPRKGADGNCGASSSRCCPLGAGRPWQELARAVVTASDTRLAPYQARSTDARKRPSHVAQRQCDRLAADSTQTLSESADASCLSPCKNPDMNDAPIVICYDGSVGAGRAIETAAVLLGARRALVLDIAPFMTAAESVAATSSVVP